MEANECRNVISRHTSRLQLTRTDGFSEFLRVLIRKLCVESLLTFNDAAFGEKF